MLTLTNSEADRRYAFVGWVDRNNEPQIYHTASLVEAHEGLDRVEYASTAKSDDECHAEEEAAAEKLRVEWFGVDGGSRLHERMDYECEKRKAPRTLRSLLMRLFPAA